MDAVPLPECGPAETLLRLLASPNIASKQAVYRQYDHQVQTNTVAGPGGSDAAVLRVKGTRKAIAVAVDGNGRHCFLDPFVGGQIAVAEVCRNLSCTGARPLALTDCLNFGNPLRPDIYYQLEECIRGMALASEMLDAPVVSGNVSLFNETQGQAVHPTPVVGALGLIENAARTVGAGFPEEGLIVGLLGVPEIREDDISDLAGSEYLQVMHGLTAGQPKVDLDLERRVQAVCREGIECGFIRSAHDCSDGGLLTALAESCILGGIGFDGRLEIPSRWDVTLFGERQSRIVVTLDRRDWGGLAQMADDENVPLSSLGRTGGDSLTIPAEVDLPVQRISEVWTRALEAAGE